jgi:hypothetical protein
MTITGKSCGHVSKGKPAQIFIYHVQKSQPTIHTAKQIVTIEENQQ